MTLKQLNSISNERKRLAQAFQSLLSSRNIIIDNFQSEYNRHVKLTAKKASPKKALLESLSRSRNMKKIQKEFLTIKSLIKENQKQSKMIKKTYQHALKMYEDTITQSKKTKKEFV